MEVTWNKMLAWAIGGLILMDFIVEIKAVLSPVIECASLRITNMKPIAIFYHCLFYLGDPPEFLTNACNIVRGQMDALRETGLLEAASEMVVGINGGKESDEIANLLFPNNAHRILHGLQCRNECRTIVALEQWAKTHPDWYVLYFHAKGATHAPMMDTARLGAGA